MSTVILLDYGHHLFVKRSMSWAVARASMSALARADAQKRWRAAATLDVRPTSRFAVARKTLREASRNSRSAGVTRVCQEPLCPMRAYASRDPRLSRIAFTEVVNATGLGVVARLVYGPQRPRSLSEGCSAGRGPSGQQYFRPASAIGASLMLAIRRRMRPSSANSQFSLP